MEGAIALMAGLPHPLLPPGIIEVPVSGFAPCAPHVACCEVQAGPYAGTYVCGFYGFGGGGGLLSFLGDFIGDAIGWVGDQLDWLADQLGSIDWEEAAKAVIMLKEAIGKVSSCEGAAAMLAGGITTMLLSASAPPPFDGALLFGGAAVALLGVASWQVHGCGET